MAFTITDLCISCGACEPECPNEAISSGDEMFAIDPLRCTECVGFYDEAACAAVCPVGAPQPDPDHVESEATLLERAKAQHPDKKFPTLADLPPSMSHFRS